MHRLRFFLNLKVFAVILAGLLIFFNTSTPILFLHEKIFVAARPMLALLNAFRLWSNGISPIHDDSNLYGELTVARAALYERSSENERLRSAIDFQEKYKQKTISATVFAYSQEMGKEYLLLDRGSESGVTKGSFAIHANGVLVGVVDAVENNFSKVGIASNGEKVFDAELIPLDIKVFAQGIGNRTFSLELLPQNSVPRPGDFVIAREHGASFLLAEVVRVETNGTGTFKEVRAVLLSRPENAKEVFIVMRK